MKKLQYTLMLFMMVLSLVMVAYKGRVFESTYVTNPDTNNRSIWVERKGETYSETFHLEPNEFDEVLQQVLMFR